MKPRISVLTLGWTIGERPSPSTATDSGFDRRHHRQGVRAWAVAFFDLQSGLKLALWARRTSLTIRAFRGPRAVRQVYDRP